MELPITHLNQIIENYPKYFSQKEFQNWRKLFSDHASMIKIEGDKLSSITNIDDALPEQIEYGEENKIFIEEWDAIETYQFENIAIIKANYSLTVDNEKRQGIDVLTLHKDKEGWHILNLIYEQTALITF